MYLVIYFSVTCMPLKIEDSSYPVIFKNAVRTTLDGGARRDLDKIGARLFSP